MAVRVDGLAEAVMDALQEYSDEVAEAAKESVKEASKECAAEIKESAPKKTGKYKKGCAVSGKPSTGGTGQPSIFARTPRPCAV